MNSKNSVLPQNKNKFLKDWRKLWLSLALFALVAIAPGCYLHSDEQEDLAKDLQERYSKIVPAGARVLEDLEEDTKQLLESQTANTDLLTETSEIALIGMSKSSVGDLLSEMKTKLQKRQDDIKQASETARRQLDERTAQKGQLEEALDKTNAAIEELEKKKTLQDRLDQAEAIIKTATTAVNEVVTTNSDDPVNKRLKNSIDEIVKFLNSQQTDEAKAEKTFSLLLESLRLGRDIIALQLEAIELEEAHARRLNSAFEAENNLIMQSNFIDQIKGDFESAVNDKETVTEAAGRLIGDFRRHGEEIEQYETEIEELDREIQTLTEAAQNANPRSSAKINQQLDAARQNKTTAEQNKERAQTARKDAEDKLTLLLDALGKFQTIQITTGNRFNEFDLKRSIENYRHARLLDAVSERQRIVLIATGLDGVVRYSEGGWRSEDIGRIVNIVGTVAEVVTAIKTN